MDSIRWQRFSARAGDIIISTPPKSGTTWMQMICALLIFQRATWDGEVAHVNLASTMHHLATFWEMRQQPNVVLVHYADLQRRSRG